MILYICYYKGLTAMTDQEYTIQDLCTRTGLPRRTIHFYTQQGLLPPPGGGGPGTRYDERHLLRLKLIPLLRQQGLRLDQIRDRFQESDLPGLQALLQQQASPPEPPPGRSCHYHYRSPRHW